MLMFIRLVKVIASYWGCRATTWALLDSTGLRTLPIIYFLNVYKSFAKQPSAKLFSTPGGWKVTAYKSIIDARGMRKQKEYKFVATLGRGVKKVGEQR